MNALCGSFVNSQNLIALQCSPIKTISSNSLDYSTNKLFTPAVKVIAQNCYTETGRVSPQQSKLRSLFVLLLHITTLHEKN